MAANKFATMVHKNSNKITLVLTYAILEWILILLLLLNSLFSYLILKFADYFGLKPPCPWCSRIDHFFEPEKKHNPLTDHICDHHATEISNFGFCTNHKKLARSEDMCGDCLSSQPGFQEESHKFSFFRMEQIDLIESDGEEDGEEYAKCSCCGKNLVSKHYSPFVLIDPSWDVIEYAQKGNLVTESEIDDLIEKNSILDRSGSGFTTVQVEKQCKVDDGLGVKELTEEKKEEDCSVLVSKFGEREEAGEESDKNKSSTIKKEEKDFTEILSQHLEFFIDYSGQQLVPIELMDSTSEENQVRCLQVEDEHDNDHEFGDYQEGHEFGDYQGAEVNSELLIETIVDLVNKNTDELLSTQEESEEVHPINKYTQELVSNLHENSEELHSVHENTEESKYSVFDSMEIEETENSLVFHAREFDFDFDLVRGDGAVIRVTRTLDDIEENAAEGKDSDSDAHSVHEDVSQIPNTENEADVSIGTEIPDLDSTDEIKAQENYTSYEFDHEEPSTSSPDLYTNGFENENEYAEEVTEELRTLAVEVNENPMNSGLSFSSDPNEMEEERTPDTPSSLDSFNQLHKKLLLLERRDSGAEESLDGSVISEMEGGDVNTAERLKSALRAERKALHALYAELEEERSASAVAASQTMAMINRLQEEKAAMQMEALHYQRMMEEQSEYDQEALQLLNDLMVKREREKQELERELEVYRRKVMEYESKEKIMRMGRTSKDGSARSGTHSASCSHSEDGDGVWIDLNHDAKEDIESFDGHLDSGNHNTPVESVLNLEDTLVDFEEERVSILEQLKVLEERLFTLTDAEDLHFADIRPIEDIYEENGKHLHLQYDSDGQEENGMVNGFPKEMNGKLYQDRRLMGAKAKRLLPLFDAISTESDDGVLVENEHGNANGNGNGNGFHSNKFENAAMTRFELEKKRIDIEEEVDQLYVRLHSLEADREFLKHSISSLKKGDKGMDLLQEILQHLRELRNVELQVKKLQ